MIDFCFFYRWVHWPNSSLSFGFSLLSFTWFALTFCLHCPRRFIVFYSPVPPSPLHLLHPPLVFPSHILCSHLASVIVSLLSPPNLPIPPHTYFSPHLPLFFPPRPPIFASFPLVFLSFPRPIIHLPFTSPPFCLPPQPPPLPALSLCREARHCRANPCWIPTTQVHTCIHTDARICTHIIFKDALGSDSMAVEAVELPAAATATGQTIPVNYTVKKTHYSSLMLLPILRPQWLLYCMLALLVLL